MGTEMKNVPAEQAQADLAAQLEPRSEGPSGTRFEGDYERAVGEQERLEREVRIGHDRTTMS